MIFRASEHQLKVMFCNAINASKPMGLGRFVANDEVHLPGTFDLGSITHMWRKDLNRYEVDYFVGRMVKLRIRQVDDGLFEIRKPPHPEYQSWCELYPTNESLALSAGCEIVESKNHEE